MKKLLALILASTMALSLVACSSEETTTEGEETQETTQTTIVDEIKENGKLVLGTEAQYAPFEFKDAQANFVGVDIWLAEQIAAELGVELEIVDMSFDGIIPAVQSSQVDIGISAFTTTPERAEVIDFTNVYWQDAQALVVHVDNVDTYTTAESVAGLKVGAQKGSFQSQLVLDTFTESELFELAKYPELALEVQNKNIAGMVVDKEVGVSFIEENDSLALSSYEFTGLEGYGKAGVVKKGNEALVEVANAVIERVVADGSLAAAYEEAVELSKTVGLDG